MRSTLSSLFSRSPKSKKSTSPYLRRLGVETLEDRLTPAGFFLTGVGGLTNPAEPNVRVYDASVAGATSNVLTPPGDIGAFAGFSGSVRVANGDVNGDGVDDIITAQGPGAGSGSMVKIFDGRSALLGGAKVELASFFAYSNVAGASQTAGFSGGVFVASADLNGDGFAELIVSAGAGARGHVKVFDFNGGTAGFLGSTPELRSSFFAYTDFAGEIRVSTLKAGGITYVVTASGAGTTQSDVRLYGNAFTIGQVPDLTLVNPTGGQFFPVAGYTGGLSVAAGDTDGDGNEELFVSKNGGGPSTVSVFDIANLSAPRATFTAFEGFNGEVRLGAADVDGDGKVEVLTSTGNSPGASGAHVKAWSITGAVSSTARSFFAYPGYSNGVFLSTHDFKVTQTFTNTTPLAIPDTNTFVPSTISVDLLTTNDSTIRPKAIQVDLNITALTGSANQNIDAFLTGPMGTQFELFTGVNSGGAGFSVTLADNASTNIGTPAGIGSVRLTGTFKPEVGNLLAQYGASAVNGVWTLNLRDNTAGGGTFRLDSWAVRLVY